MDAGRRKSRRHHGKRRVPKGHRSEALLDDGEARGLPIHWVIIGLSILLVTGLSFVNFLALPDMRANIFHHRLAKDALIHTTSLGTLPPQAAPAARQAAAPQFLQPSVAPPGIETHPALRGQPQSTPPAVPAGAPAAAPPSALAVALAERAKAASAGPDNATVTRVARSGGVAVFDGETWLEHRQAVDADELTLSAWIFLPDVPPNTFPLSSGSMKTIVSTKMSGCKAQNPQVSGGWAFFVHEWGTTNRQLRLSWTEGGSSCHELFSTTSLVPYDTWVQVGFSLSKKQNRASVFLGGSLVADTLTGAGSYVRAGEKKPMSQASLATRLVQLGEGSILYLGSHAPQAEDNPKQNSHMFLGFLGDFRLLHVAPEDPNLALSILASSPEELLQKGLAQASSIVAQLQFAGQPGQVQNLVDSIQLFTRSAGGGTSDGPFPTVPWSSKPKHPLLDDGIPEVSIPGPTLDPAALRKTWPQEWLANFDDKTLLDSQAKADKWADEVRDAMRHSWRGYRKRAFGRDEMKPVSGGAKDWCKLGITMLDALSTLWVMGLHEEFGEAETYLSSHPFPSPGAHGMNSFFEISIRALGGLLSAHSLSGRQLFLDLAKKLADTLMPAFNTPSGMPMAEVDVGTGQARWHRWTQNAVLAEVGTVQVELRYLSHATGVASYAQAGDRAFNSILAAAGDRGLVPIYLSKTEEVPHFTGTKISLGAMGDSYYEYLLKQWLQSGKVEDRFKDLWKRSMKEMIEKLIVKTDNGLTMVAEMENNNRKNRMDHLACFVGGMLILGARTLPKAEVDPKWEELAAEITRTCHEFYKLGKLGLSPEYVSFKTDAGISVPNDAPHNLLRPEAAEAIYYMHYYTGNPMYREWAYEMWSGFKRAKVRFGYSAIKDIRADPPRYNDAEESFWFAETLKYLYMTFAPRSALNLEEFVLTTEAHPLRMWGAAR